MDIVLAVAADDHLLDVGFRNDFTLGIGCFETLGDDGLQYKTKERCQVAQPGKTDTNLNQLLGFLGVAERFEQR